MQRLVYDTLKDLSGNPLRKKLIIFRLLDFTNTTENLIVPSTVSTYTDESGYFSIELVASECLYEICYSGNSFKFLVPKGEEPLHLAMIKECGGLSWKDPSFGATLEYLKNNLNQFNFTVEVERSTTYEQNTPATIWHVNHFLGKYPHVSAMDKEGDFLIGNVEYIDLNNLNFEVNPAMAGILYLN